MARYTIEGVEYPSVTEIIEACTDKSAPLIQWAVSCAVKYIQESYQDNLTKDELFELLQKAKYEYKNVSEEAKTIGSQVHDLIEHYIKFDLDKSIRQQYPNEVQNSFLAFLEWEANNNVKWKKSELVLYHPTLFFAGQIDTICQIDNQLFVVDFKTSKGFYDGYDLQIAGYMELYNANNPDNQIINAGILRIDKETGIPEFKDYSKNIDTKLKAFLLLVDFFYTYKNRRLKNNPRVNGLIKIVE